MRDHAYCRRFADNSSKCSFCPATQITDISALAGARRPETLDLSGNSISDISVVSGCKQLVDLNVSSNQITELPQFDADTPLWHVDISHNQIESLAGLKEISPSNFINADYNRIKSISKLESCIMLVRMNLWDNPVNADEVKPLQGHRHSHHTTPSM